MIRVVGGGISVDVPCTNTVAELKQALQIRCGVPAVEQRLLAAGKTLCDAEACPTGKVMLMRKPATSRATVSVTLRDTRGRVLSAVALQPEDTVASAVDLAQNALKTGEGSFALFNEETKTLLRPDLALADYGLRDGGTLWLVPRPSLGSGSGAHHGRTEPDLAQLPTTLLRLPPSITQMADGLAELAASSDTAAASAASGASATSGASSVASSATSATSATSAATLAATLASSAKPAAGGDAPPLVAQLTVGGVPLLLPLAAFGGGGDGDAACPVEQPAEAAAAAAAAAAARVPAQLRAGLVGDGGPLSGTLPPSLLRQALEQMAAGGGASGAEVQQEVERQQETAFEERCVAPCARARRCRPSASPHIAPTHPRLCRRCARVVASLAAVAGPSNPPPSTSAAGAAAAAAAPKDEAWGSGLKAGMRRGFLSAPPRTRRAPKRAQAAASARMPAGAPAPPAGAPAATTAPLAATAAAPADKGERSGAHPPSDPADRADPTKRRKQLQCAACACRLPLATAELCCRCRCGQLYCAAHRHQHRCAAASSLKEAQRRVLQSNNPRITPSKLEAI